MPRTSTRSSSRATTRKARASRAPNAITMLTEDHAKVKKMFKQFEKMKEDGEEAEKQKLVEQICRELTLHAQIEEEIFYPAAREALEDDQDIMDEAEVEHASAKELIAQLRDMSPDDGLYDAKVTVLGEYVDHHIEEEEKEMFPKVKKSRALDLEELAEQIEARKGSEPQ